MGDPTKVLAEADPRDKAELYRELGISVIYHPDQRKVVAEVRLPIACTQVRVGGGT